MLSKYPVIASRDNAVTTMPGYKLNGTDYISIRNWEFFSSQLTSESIKTKQIFCMTGGSEEEKWRPGRII
jgi:hypothetical protein